MSMTLPPYHKIAEMFNHSDLLPTPAEAHGLICGFICAGKKLDGKSWLDWLMNSVMKEPENWLNAYRTILLELYEISSIKLQSFEFDFELLLPEDDEPLAVRAEALGDWCKGFIVALNRVGITEAQMAAPDCKEALTHLLEISELDYEIIDVQEQDEEAYMSVSEYVKVAVLMIYSEIAMMQDKPVGGGISGRQLH